MFDICNRATWPEVLSLAEFAAIVRRSENAVRKDAYAFTLIPAPAFRRPLRWRKSDVTRHIDGQIRRVA